MRINQLEMHEAMEDFVNGYTLENSSKLFFPLVDRNILFGRSMKGKEAAKLISDFYRKYRSGGKKKKIKIGKNFSEWKKKARGTRTNIIKDIRNYVQREMRPYIVDFFIHGSFSTMDISEWSDIDSLVILRREVVEDPELLLRVRKKMMGINKMLLLNDPLQHHGVFVVTEHELENYRQSFLPVEVLGYSTSFFGTKNLQVRINTSKEDARKILKEHINYIKRFKSNSLYDWKLFCHIMLLLPLLYLQARGKYMYKKFSFSKARPMFGKEWSVIDEFSAIRKGFSYRPKWNRVIVKLSPNFWYPLALTRIFVKAPEETEHLVRKGKIFVKKMEAMSW